MTARFILISCSRTIREEIKRVDRDVPALTLSPMRFKGILHIHLNKAGTDGLTLKSVNILPRFVLRDVECFHARHPQNQNTSPQSENEPRRQLKYSSPSPSNTLAGCRLARSLRTLTPNRI